MQLTASRRKCPHWWLLGLLVLQCAQRLQNCSLPFPQRFPPSVGSLSRQGRSLFRSRVNHTRRWQHRRDPSGAGAVRWVWRWVWVLCSGRDGATVRAASAGPQSCIPGSPLGRWASGSARGSPNRPRLLLCPSQLPLRKVNFGTQSSVFIGIMNSRNCFHVRARTSFQGVRKGHSVW